MIKSKVALISSVVIQIENNETPAIYLDSRFIRFANLIGAEVEFDQYIFS